MNVTLQRVRQLLRAEQLRREQLSKLDTAHTAEQMEIARALRIASMLVRLTEIKRRSHEQDEQND